MTRSLLVALCCMGACDNAIPSSPELGPAPPGVPAAGDSDVPAAADVPNVPPRADVPESPRPEAAAYPSSRGRSLQWKRSAAFEADLMRGLSLTRDEVCRELGSQSCVHAVHTVALGGNDPFGSGLLRPATSSLSTTPLAVDRVTLSACSQRARYDKAGDPKVFTELDLSGMAPEPDAAAVTKTITTLFRRLLARDPRSNELAIVKELLANDAEHMTAEEFATLSCFVVASSIESLFF